MYFYVDESGHSGSILFDTDQPCLYYGVLSSPHDIDVEAEAELAYLRSKVGSSRLHATELGIGRLLEIAPRIEQLQLNLEMNFDIYRFVKADHAVISFFDQVFDSGVNQGVPYEAYWTPLRYLILLEVASLFTPDLAKQAWSARVEPRNAIAEAELIEVCRALMQDIKEIRSSEIRKIVRKGLAWAIKHPNELGYNVSNSKEVTSILPNSVAFQLVMQGIASRLQSAEATATKILVDRQSQFNGSQRFLAEFYSSLKDLRVEVEAGMPKLDWSNMPTIPLQIATDAPSAGLELVDLRLWVSKKWFDRKAPAELVKQILGPHLERSMTNDVSLEGIARRWLPLLFPQHQN